MTDLQKHHARWMTVAELATMGIEDGDGVVAIERPGDKWNMPPFQLVALVSLGTGEDLPASLNPHPELLLDATQIDPAYFVDNKLVEHYTVAARFMESKTIWVTAMHRDTKLLVHWPDSDLSIP